MQNTTKIDYSHLISQAIVKNNIAFIRRVVCQNLYFKDIEHIIQLCVQILFSPAENWWRGNNANNGNNGNNANNMQIYAQTIIIQLFLFCLKNETELSGQKMKAAAEQFFGANIGWYNKLLPVCPVIHAIHQNSTNSTNSINSTNNN